jgi:hypothetical protein
MSPAAQSPNVSPEIKQRLDELERLWRDLVTQYHATTDTNRRAEIERQSKEIHREMSKLLAKTLPSGIQHPIEPDVVTGINRQSVLDDADVRSAQRSARVTSRLAKIETGNILIYQSQSRDSFKVWTQLVRINTHKMQAMFGIKRALNSDMLVYCDCPAFKYWGYQYICTSRRIIMPGHDENRFPGIRNPHLVGTVCKHLIRVLTQLPEDAKQIYKLLNGKGTAA